MLRLVEAKEISLNYYNQNVTWDQVLELMKGRKKFTIEAKAGGLKRNGFDMELQNARIKFYPMGLMVKSGNLTFCAWNKVLISLEAHLSPRDDATVVVTLTYGVGADFQYVKIAGL